MKDILLIDSVTGRYKITSRLHAIQILYGFEELEGLLKDSSKLETKKQFSIKELEPFVVLHQECQKFASNIKGATNFITAIQVSAI